MTQPIRILIADDHQIVAQALHNVLSNEEDLEVVGIAYDGNQAVEEADRLHPDVVLMDVLMPGRDGVAATRAILARNRDIKVVMLSGSGQKKLVIDAIEAGASGYVSKERALSDVIGAVRAASKGDLSLSAESLHDVLQEIRDRRRRPESDGQTVRLTDRELEVLTAMVSGADNATIAERLVISPHTLRTHLQNIMHKFNAHSKLEVITIALRQGLVEVPRE